ncbi:hypothetical protein HMPREF3291_06970 [Bacillus sp. HMSC76G11]|nr:hypothetical protein HMPREF3291_06970 [Bacillus sp. HMSC76G11]
MISGVLSDNLLFFDSHRESYISGIYFYVYLAIYLIEQLDFPFLAEVNHHQLYFLSEKPNEKAPLRVLFQ